MTPTLLLYCIGLAVGVWLIVMHLPVLKRPSLNDRVTPYLGLVERPSRLLSSSREISPWPTAERLVRPVLTNCARKLDKVMGGRASVTSRLDRLDSETTIERFRLEQLLWGVAGSFSACALLGARYVSGEGGSLAPFALLATVAFVAGVLARDRLLTVAMQKRAAEIHSEFPTIIELLALAVGAGEGMVSALERVSRVGHGPLVNELDRALGELRAGSALVDALGRLALRVDLPEVRRFVDALVVAIERGTPLAVVLTAQAADARESQRQALIESGGRKEIAMMIPVVFLVLPLSVVFALFPGFYGLSLGA